MAGAWEDLLRAVTRVAGVRGALVMSADDGLLVAETAMTDLETADVAALAAALVTRAARTCDAIEPSIPRLLHLEASAGAILAAAGPTPLWLVAVTTPDAEFGKLRLLLGDLAGVLD